MSDAGSRGVVLNLAQRGREALEERLKGRLAADYSRVRSVLSGAGTPAALVDVVGSFGMGLWRGDRDTRVDLVRYPPLPSNPASLPHGPPFHSADDGWAVRILREKQQAGLSTATPSSSSLWGDLVDANVRCKAQTVMLAHTQHTSKLCRNIGDDHSSAITGGGHHGGAENLSGHPHLSNPTHPYPLRLSTSPTTPHSARCGSLRGNADGVGFVLPLRPGGRMATIVSAVALVRAYVLLNPALVVAANILRDWSVAHSAWTPAWHAHGPRPSHAHGIIKEPTWHNAVFHHYFADIVGAGLTGGEDVNVAGRAMHPFALTLLIIAAAIDTDKTTRHNERGSPAAASRRGVLNHPVQSSCEIVAQFVEKGLSGAQRNASEGGSDNLTEVERFLALRVIPKVVQSLSADSDEDDNEAQPQGPPSEWAIVINFFTWVSTGKLLSGPVLLEVPSVQARQCPHPSSVVAAHDDVSDTTTTTTSHDTTDGSLLFLGMARDPRFNLAAGLDANFANRLRTVADASLQWLQDPSRAPDADFARDAECLSACHRQRHCSRCGVPITTKKVDMCHRCTKRLSVSPSSVPVVSTAPRHDEATSAAPSMMSRGRGSGRGGGRASAPLTANAMRGTGARGGSGRGAGCHSPLSAVSSSAYTSPGAIQQCLSCGIDLEAYLVLAGMDVCVKCNI